MSDEISPDGQPPEPALKPKRVVRRTRMESAALPPMPQEETALVDAAPAAAPLRTPYLQRNFIGALVLGAVLSLAGSNDSVLASWLGLIGPIAVVVSFYVFGLRHGWSQHADTRQRFADACYFLGFLFTMWALMVGFVPAGLGFHKLGSTEILRHFGMALGATAAGLICRILVLQSGSFGDDAAHVEADLHAYASRVTAEAAAIADSLSRARDDVLSGQRTIADRMGSALNSSLDDMAGKVARGAAVLSSALMNGAEQAEAAVLQFKTKLESNTFAAEQAAENSVAAYENLGSSAKAVSSELNAFHSALALSRESVVAAFGAATSQMQRLADELQTNQGTADRINEAVQSIEVGLNAVNGQVEALNDAARASRSAVDQHAESAAAVQQEIVRHVDSERAAIEKRLSDDRAGFAGEMGRAAHELTRIVEGFSDQLAKLRAENQRP
jgi:hypothetical protein